MPSVNIDIPVSPELQDALDVLSCEAISINGSTMTGITLPQGVELPALRNLGGSIPDDCALSFSLMLQLMPFLASITCLFRVLALIKPLVSIIQGLPAPPSPQVLDDFGEAAGNLLPCFGMILPVNLLPFIRDVLCFIRALCNCLATNLQSVQSMLLDLEAQIEAAAGNQDLLGTLSCAQQNAQASAANLNLAIEPIGSLLTLVQPLMSIAGQSFNVQAPSAGAAPQAASDLTPIIETLQAVVEAIDALGLGCGS